MKQRHFEQSAQLMRSCHLQDSVRPAFPGNASGYRGHPGVHCRTGGHPKATPQQVTEAPIIPAGFHCSQQSATPFAISRDSSSDYGLIPTTYSTQKAGEALRVTRWFRHE